MGFTASSFPRCKKTIDFAVELSYAFGVVFVVRAQCQRIGDDGPKKGATDPCIERWWNLGGEDAPEEQDGAEEKWSEGRKHGWC